MKKTLCVFLASIFIAPCLFSQSVPKVTFQEQQEKNLEYQYWKDKLDQAKRDRSNGRLMLYSGLGAAGLGAVFMIYGLQKETLTVWDVSITYKPHENMQWVGLAFIAGGTFLGIWGNLKKNDAQEKIAELERDGKKKGFLTYSYNPATQTIYIGYNIKF